MPGCNLCPLHASGQYTAIEMRERGKLASGGLHYQLKLRIGLLKIAGLGKREPVLEARSYTVTRGWPLQIMRFTDICLIQGKQINQ
jgi:hypothetical protein